MLLVAMDRSRVRLLISSIPVLVLVVKVATWLRESAFVSDVLLMTMSRFPWNALLVWLRALSYPVAPLARTLRLLVRIRVVIVDGVSLIMSLCLRLCLYVCCNVDTVAAPFVLVGLISILIIWFESVTPASVVVRLLLSTWFPSLGCPAICLMAASGMAGVAAARVCLRRWLLVVSSLLEENSVERPGWNMSALLGWWNVVGSDVSLGGARCSEVVLVVLMIRLMTVL